MTPELAEKKAYLKEHDITKPSDVFSIYRKDILWLSGGMLESGFPPQRHPLKRRSLRSHLSFHSSRSRPRPELAAWLDGAPTVLTNLGSSADYDEFGATEMAKVVKTLLDNSPVPSFMEIQ